MATIFRATEALKHLGSEGEGAAGEGPGQVSKIHWVRKEDIAVCLPPNDRIRNHVFLNPWMLRKILGSNLQSYKFSNLMQILQSSARVEI